MAIEAKTWSKGLRRFFHCIRSLAKYSQKRASWALLSLLTPSVHLDFVLPWFCLPSGTSLNRAFCGRSLASLIMCPAYHNLLLFTTPMTIGLLNSLSSSKLSLLLHTPSTIFGLYIVRRFFFSMTSNRFPSLSVSTRNSSRQKP
jgi:hypothetical protein